MQWRARSSTGRRRGAHHFAMYTGLDAQETVIYVVLAALHDPLLIGVAVIGLIGLVAMLGSGK
jgi:hypothetical protein